jgi:UDP:flavonoid glycosyltransferase YjiC (YdhE family)
LHFLLTPVGSSGDVHPYVGIGRRLRERGHAVTLFAAEPHRRTVEGAGLEFVSVFTEHDYEAATHDPDLWHPTRSFKTVARLLLLGLESSWRELAARYVPGKSFLVGHALAFATRSFEEKVGAPAATLQLAPSSLRSAFQVPALPGVVDVSRLPLALKRTLWWLIDVTQLDPHLVPELNRWRASKGLTAVRRVFREWLNSPRLVLALFPEWFGARQPDWPRCLEFASFPLWDDPHAHPVDPELDAFLSAGAPPVVATPGSANRQAERFFAAVVGALARLGRRGLLLTQYPEQLPSGLPATIVARKYAPLSRVLPRAAALVHHGGIGTAAQAYAAGVPQLVMPMAFDQPDNALRAQRLGVARFVLPKRFTGESVAAALRALLDDPAVAAAAARRRDELRDVDGVALACDALERSATAG